MEVEEFSYIPRPFKIAKEDQKFKGIVAKSLKELKEKAFKSLNMSKLVNMDVSLAEDGTLIDDEEYFATLLANTKLIVKDAYIKAYDEGSYDVPDGICDMEKSNNQHPSSSHTIPSSLKKKLTSKNIAECVIAFVGMSTEELDFFSNCDVDVVVEELDVDEDVARVYVENASKELLRRQELSHASQLLSLFQSAKLKSENSDGTKRKRMLET